MLGTWKFEEVAISPFHLPVTLTLKKGQPPLIMSTTDLYSISVDEFLQFEFIFELSEHFRCPMGRIHEIKHIPHLKEHILTIFDRVLSKPCKRHMIYIIRRAEMTRKRRLLDQI
jgi:hypothetical protein